MKHRNELIDNITKLVKAQDESLEIVTLKLAAFRDDEFDIPQLVFLELHFTKREDIELEEISHDWGPLIIDKRIITPEYGLRIIKGILLENTLKIDDLDDINVDLQLRVDPIPYTSMMSYLHDKWPLHLFKMNVRHIRKPHPEKLPALLDRPYYPTFENAIEALLKTRPRIDRLEGVDIIIPDYRAKIDDLHLGSGYVALEVSCGSLSENQVVAKMFVRGESKSIGSNNLRIEDGRAVFKIDFEVEYVDAIILEKKNGEKIDSRLFQFFGLLDQTGVVYDEFEKHIREIIDQGEGPRVEFKRSLNQDKKREYLESIVAFANSRGGYLIIGVNDDGEIVGSNQEVEELLRNQIHSLCNPSIDVKIRENIQIDGVEITVVQVPDGNQKPYLLQGKGYVRRGATDRVMKREELEKEFKEGGFLFGQRRFL